jgi:hypothetical protein
VGVSEDYEPGDVGNTIGDTQPKGSVGTTVALSQRSLYDPVSSTLGEEQSSVAGGDDRIKE